MAQDIVVQQVQQNVKDNKAEEQKAKNTNKALAKKIEETFNYLNRNRSSVQQQPNKSAVDFLTRIQSFESLAFDPNIFKDKAAIEGNRNLMENLKEITMDETKISDIAKSFSKPEEVFVINNNWPTIFNQIKNKIWCQ